MRDIRRRAAGIGVVQPPRKYPVATRCGRGVGTRRVRSGLRSHRGKRRGTMENLNVVMISVTSRDDGLRVLDRVDVATETGEINVEDVAMVYKNENGKVKIQQTADATA